MRKPALKLVFSILLLVVSGSVHAHAGHAHSGWTAGMLHPVFGLDHLLAMLAVGLWAAQSGSRQLWMLPVTFMLMMSTGAGLAMYGQQLLPLLESGIAVSVLTLGLLVALALRLPAWLSMALVALFGMLHGYAHGLELPASAAPLSYAFGFLVATAVLHLGGMAAGVACRQRHAMLAKMMGGAIAFSGATLFALP